MPEAGKPWLCLIMNFVGLSLLLPETGGPFSRFFAVVVLWILLVALGRPANGDHGTIVAYGSATGLFAAVLIRTPLLHFLGHVQAGYVFCQAVVLLTWLVVLLSIKMHSMNPTEQHAGIQQDESPDTRSQEDPGIRE